MSIKFWDERDIQGLKLASYELFRRDQQKTDKILDSLVKNSCVKSVLLEKLSAAALSAFIVWNKGKSRLVVDLWKVNTKLYSDAYSLLKQDEVLEALEKSKIFITLNMQKDFFQQSIAE